MLTNSEDGTPSHGQLRQFLTGLNPAEEIASDQTAVGNDWRASVIRGVRDPSGPDSQASEIIIEASSDINAQRALDLIIASHSVLNGEPNTIQGIQVWEIDRPVPSIEDDSFELAIQSAATGILTAPHLWLACTLGAKASQRTDLEYAVHQVSASLSLHSNFLVDLDPARWPYEHRSTRPKDHVRYRAAIVTAFAAIEQVELAVRSSKNNPSMDESGRWHAHSLANLQKRLADSGINPSTKVLWEARGAQSKIPLRAAERHLPASWSDGNEVRDGFLPIADAIAQAQYLRNKVAAHRASDLAAELSIHDVHNCQLVARRLVLGLLGAWPTADPEESD